jgi:SAM-dependent methyltransferase
VRPAAADLERRLEARLGSVHTLGVPRLTERVLDFVRDREARRVLDLGAGCGELVSRLREEGRRAVGVDLCEGMLARARDGASAPPELVRGDVERLPVASGSVDVVTCLLVVHYLARPERALAEAARVLRPGGWLALADRIASPAPALRQRQHRIETLRNPSVRKLLTSREISDGLRRAGFRVALVEFLEEAALLDDWLAGVDAARASRIRRELRESPVRDLGGLHFEAPSGVRLRLDLILARKV